MAGTQLIVVNTYFISGAWSGHRQRSARWNQRYQVLHDKVAALVRNHPGVPVFVIGHFNRAQAMGHAGPGTVGPGSGRRPDRPHVHAVHHQPHHGHPRTDVRLEPQRVQDIRDRLSEQGGVPTWCVTPTRGNGLGALILEATNHMVCHRSGNVSASVGEPACEPGTGG